MTLTTNTATEYLIDWRRYGLNVALILESNMVAIADDTAYAHGWVSDTIEGESDLLPITSDEDVIQALH